MASTLDILLPLNRLESGNRARHRRVPRERRNYTQKTAGCLQRRSKPLLFRTLSNLSHSCWDALIVLKCYRMHFIFIWWDDSISHLRSLPTPQRTVGEKTHSFTCTYTQKNPTKLLILSSGNCNCFIKESFEKSSYFFSPRHLTLQ